jgi:hypothetical protein
MKKVIVVLAAAMLVSACGGGGGSTSSNNQQTNSNISTGKNSVAAKTASLPVGDSSCPYGGILVSTGVDINGNGLLDTSEVTNSQPVCNGATGTAGSAGTNGKNALVKTTTETAGANCSAGGLKIDIGSDINNNGVLDVAEVSNTSYTCNGIAGTSNTSVLSWVNTISTTQQAVSNTGYVANSSSQVAITLPASPSVGDITEVSGAGAGGWKIILNSGQSIVTKDVTAVYPQIASLNIPVNQFTMSSDGNKIAVIFNDTKVYTSPDAGSTWLSNTVVGASNLSSIASSSDGVKLAVTASNGDIYTSTNSGSSWTQRVLSSAWTKIVSSADGTKLVAYASSNGEIYTSSNSGVSWAASPVFISGLSEFVMSADGSKLAAIKNNGQIYVSTNSGGAWTATAPLAYWNSITASSDGSKLVAVTLYGQEYTSADSGLTWTNRGYIGTFGHLTSSADGNIVIIGNSLFSFDAGTTWTPQPSSPYAVGSRLTADGRKLVYNLNGDFYVANVKTATAAGTPGILNGKQYDYIKLQYMGNNIFNIIDNNGGLLVQ